MTSVERSYSTIPAGSGFFITLADASDKVFNLADIAAYSGAIVFEDLGSVLNVTSGTAATTSSGGAKELVTYLQDNTTVSTVLSDTVDEANKIVRDLGKTLYVQQNGQNVQIFRYVTAVSNVTGEGALPTASVSGVNSDNGFFIPVWSADGTGLVPVARTGF
jgi:hypothetical protein